MLTSGFFKYTVSIVINANPLRSGWRLSSIGLCARLVFLVDLVDLLIKIVRCPVAAIDGVAQYVERYPAISQCLPIAAHRVDHRRERRIVGDLRRQRALGR